MRHVDRRARRAGALLAAVLTWAGLLAGAAGCTSGGPGPLERLFRDPPSAQDVIRVLPDDGSKDVRPEQKLRVRAAEGRLESVRVVKSQDAQDTPVAGRLSDDGRTWRPDDDRLALAAQYTVDAVAEDGDGRRQARHAVFTTWVPPERFVGYVIPEDRSVVGVGMIVSLTFNREISDRAAVERAVRVTARPSVEVRPHWFGDSRLDFRPQRYWKTGTHVTVDLRLRDVQGSPGVYGQQDKTFSFTVGRSQVSVVDAAAHTMQVVRDGKLLAVVPITAGAPGSATYNGTMVVKQMLEVTRMNGGTVGYGGEYDIPDVPHAMRLTDSGTFVHGNYWSATNPFGQRNVSHGCVGLQDVKGGSSATPAGWFFDRSLVGDVVQVVRSDDATVSPSNGLSGWNMDWRQWTAGSALNPAPATGK
ncbi:Ig-like domain-containing protein [Streptomyces sp. NPDC046985]|uniref:L,D-transpeptidase n=1 Tax=Streptomyces sp. NPDC046985 TaxID=3155377 RepID=UPI0033F84500